MRKTSKIIIFLVLSTYMHISYATLSYGDLFIVEDAKNTNLTTKLYLGTNTDNNLLNSNHLKIEQRIAVYHLSSLWISYIHRESNLNSTANALNKATDITQTVNTPLNTYALKYQLEFMRSSTSIFNKHFGTIISNLFLSYGKTMYEKPNAFESNLVDSLSAGIDFQLPMDEYSLLLSYQRNFDNPFGDYSFSYNEISLGFGLQW